jgi:hypothetical protein
VRADTELRRICPQDMPTDLHLKLVLCTFAARTTRYVSSFSGKSPSTIWIELAAPPGAVSVPIPDL